MSSLWLGPRQRYPGFRTTVKTAALPSSFWVVLLFPVPDSLVELSGIVVVGCVPSVVVVTVNNKNMSKIKHGCIPMN